MPSRAVTTQSAQVGGGSAARTRPVPGLTPRDRAQLAAVGRPTLIRRLRTRAGTAWAAATGTMITGMTMLAVRPIEDDTGLWVTFASLPLMLVAAHQSGRLQRLRLNDPDRPPPLVAAGGAAIPAAEAADLALVRSRLLATLPSLDLVAPQVAEEVRSADRAAHPTLARHAEALVVLDGLPVVAEPATLAAREEIRGHLQAGIGQYQQLLAESVLLLSRAGTLAGTGAVGPLADARDLVATHSEGLRRASATDDVPDRP